GANRGIGFQLVSRFLEQGYTVHGTVRPQMKNDPSVSDASLNPRAKLLELDFTIEETILQAAKDFGDHVLDILVNCAGDPLTHSLRLYYLWDDKPFTEQSADDLLSHFKVNVVGPFLASKAFSPALERSPLGKIINVSSDFASITDNTGGNACYRVSKTALNQLTKNMALDLNKLGVSNVRTLAVHPGYVATKMTGYHGEDDMETCMNGLVQLIERFGTDDGKAIASGAYVRWNGDHMSY
ncbi:NAD(P)-binding protein, partial [Tothia fuscella]